MNLVEIFNSQVQNNKDKIAYTFLADGEDKALTITYSELESKAKAVAANLQEKYKTGDRAILLFDTGLDFIVSLWGCFLSGIVAVPIHPPVDMRSVGKLLSIFKDSSPSVILTTADFILKMSFFQSAMKDLPVIDKVDIEKIESNASDLKNFDVSDDTDALIQYTSGSVGPSKGVLLSHNNIVYNAHMLQAVLEEIPPPNANKDSFLCWLPLYHDMGLMSGVILPLVMGTTSTLMSPLMFLQKPFRWLKALSKYKATVSAAPNFAYELCIKKVKEEQLAELDLSSWSVALNGAEAIRNNTLERFTEKFSATGFKHQYFFPAYGLAESVVFVTGPSRNELPITLNIDKDALENNKISITDNSAKVSVTSTGHSWLAEKILIVNPQTFEECKSDEIGEVWIQGESIAKGYWNLDNETEINFKAHLADKPEENFLRTGDLGFFQDRNLFITGRIKDLIIIRGNNYYPHHIEQTTEQFSPAFRPGSTAAFSVNIDNEEKLVVVQELKKDANIDNLDQLKNSLKKLIIEEHGIPLYEAVFLKQGSIFKTSSGKVQRKLCKNKYLKGELELWK